MTLSQVLGQVDSLCPNAFSQADKRRWLNEAEKQVYELLHRHGHEQDYIPITADSPADTALLAPEEFAGAYLFYIQSQMDYHSGEAARCNNAALRFDGELSRLRNFCNARTPETGRQLQYF